MLNSRRLDAIASKLDRIDAALVVRDPGTARSVEVFEGLRRSVTAAMRERRAHLIQLVLMREALDRGASVDTLRDLVEEWSLQAGVRAWTSPEPAEFYEVVEGAGDTLEVTSPAWVDDSGETPVLVKAGLARLCPGPSVEPNVPTLDVQNRATAADSPDGSAPIVAQTDEAAP